MEGCIKQNNAIEIYEVSNLLQQLIPSTLYRTTLLQQLYNLYIVQDYFIATTNTINIVQDYFNATTNTINIVNVQDYFNEVDEATDCEEPRAKTVNLYRFFYFLF